MYRYGEREGEKDCDRMKQTGTESDMEREQQSSEKNESMCKRENIRTKERKREMSLLFTLMLQCSLLRRGRTRGPYHPICCPCLCVSQLISLTKSGIIFQLSFIPFLSLPCLSLSLSLSLCPSFSHISVHTLPLCSHRCLKRVLETLGSADSTYSTHEDVRETSIKSALNNHHMR